MDFIKKIIQTISNPDFSPATAILIIVLAIILLAAVIVINGNLLGIVFSLFQ